MSQSELHAIEIAEKAASTLSVVGAAFVLTTFLLNKRFRKPINRLVFYAAFGNLLANVATIISRSGIELGTNSALCQFQAFLIQWFLPADALWTFAMACNVWLTFFHQYDSASLRRLEWKYLCFCYGLPFIPALTYLLVHNAERGKVYGSALLWCWVSSDWNVLRIATFYGPVWLFIAANVIIYIKVGIVVFRWRNQLMSMDHKKSQLGRLNAGVRNSQAHAPPQTYETEIYSQVPHDTARSKRESYSKIDFENALASPTTPNMHRGESLRAKFHEVPARTTTIVHHPTRLDANKATISYCYTALLFFIALLATWVPSTVNRLYTLIRPNASSPFGLDFASGLVLPLQGFWNCVIYTYTSQPACKAVLQDLKDFFSPRKPENNTWDLPKPGRRKHGSQPLGSTDTRANIVISLDGKRRTVLHRSNESVFTTDDTVPELMSPAKTKVPDFKRYSSISDATTAGGATLGYSQSQRSRRPSGQSSSRGSHIVDQLDVVKQKRMGSEESRIGFV